MKERGVWLPSGELKLVPPLIEKPEPLEDFSFDSQLEYFNQLAQIREKHSLWQNEVDIKVETGGLPLFLIPISDPHLGHKGVDYSAIKKYINFIRDYPVSTILLGDILDNFSPALIPEGMLSDIAPPEEQATITRAFFKEFSDKILAVVGGNHDAGTKRKSGFELHRYLAEDLNIPLLYGGGVINLTVDDEAYKIRGYHAINRFNSSFNATHAGKRALELAGDADIIMSGHTHRGAVEKTTHRDHTKPTIVACGTFKTEDDFQKNIGRIVPTDIFYPILALFPNRHNVEAVEDLDTAKEMIEMTNLYYKQVAVSLLK